MIKRLLMALAMTAVLAGCGSNVKLDDVPVDDRSGTTIGTTPGGTGAGTGAAAQTGVTPVTIDPNAGSAPGPAGVARVIYFDYDSYVIKSEFQPLIESHARFLKANSSRRIAIEGHTDERGGREYNLALGQRRAEAVRRSLGLLGIGDGQVEAVSFGKEKPADSGSGEASWAKNRRAEIAYR
ncbi:MAG: peptidoglycan-associated lipoprotein Pal [Comamonadaceae bacterium]|nr:MAG: peptidoglycan-associated lipoprotein Pal [Comamonadaceae bacterium]